MPVDRLLNWRRILDQIRNQSGTGKSVKPAKVKTAKFGETRVGWRADLLAEKAIASRLQPAFER